MNLTEPLYQQLMDSIKHKIVSGELKVGDKILSERAMAERYGINRMTVRNAIKNLEKEGILKSQRGSGTFVEKVPKIDGKLALGSDNLISSLSMQIRQNGMKSTRIVLSIKKVSCAGELKEYFPKEVCLYEIIRLSMINDNPYALQKAYIPCSIFKDAERFDFSNFSLYDYMDDQGHRPKKMDSTLQIEPLPEEYLEVMGVEKNKNMFLFNYFGKDEQDLLVEYTISYHHPEYTNFQYTTSVGN